MASGAMINFDTKDHVECFCGNTPSRGQGYIYSNVLGTPLGAAELSDPNARLDHILCIDCGRVLKLFMDCRDPEGRAGTAMEANRLEPQVVDSKVHDFIVSGVV